MWINRHAPTTSLLDEPDAQVSLRKAAGSTHAVIDNDRRALGWAYSSAGAVDLHAKLRASGRLPVATVKL